ncbi:MAG TPA: hypothetical protein VFC44_03045 [Candidatus Saccharimonadales bacterium]|nr:hypothetical protein [Candidatus Saccharimonadales bacterium]
MKTALPLSHRARRSQSGSAVVVVLILLAIMLILSQANTITLNRLRHEVKAMERHQIQRLAAPVIPAATHQPTSQ